MTTEDQNTDTNPEQEPQQDELTLLKQRADQMGVKYHPSIGLDKLREKVNEVLSDDDSDNEDPEGPDDNGPTPPASDNNAADNGPPAEEPAEIPVGAEQQPGESFGQYRARKKREAEALVRVRVTCMDPNRREHDGALFTVSNSLVGTLRKYVPFDVEWHVPRLMLNVIRAKECQVFYTLKDKRGNKMRKGRLVKAYGVEELPPLNKTELQELARRQAMASGTTTAD